jgi:hypothetical protein
MRIAGAHRKNNFLQRKNRKIPVTNTANSKRTIQKNLRQSDKVMAHADGNKTPKLENGRESEVQLV